MSSENQEISGVEVISSDNFWAPLYFLAVFFIFIGIVYFYAYSREIRDFRKVRQTLLIDEPANESHRHYILSVSFKKSFSFAFNSNADGRSHWRPLAVKSISRETLLLK